jgi:hypothetical protein
MRERRGDWKPQDGHLMTSQPAFSGQEPQTNVPCVNRAPHNEHENSVPS